jgi:hypothetical protein
MKLEKALTRDGGLGNKEFKCVIEQKTNRKTAPSKKGGDRKSLEYQKKLKINRV